MSCLKIPNRGRHYLLRLAQQRIRCPIYHVQQSRCLDTCIESITLVLPFFILYVLLGVYFVTNLILAVALLYTIALRVKLAKQVGEKDRIRTRILKIAFNLIDENNHGFLNKEQCTHLFEELYRYRTLPNISREDFELIFDELDDSHDFKINLDEFADLCNAIALRFQKEDSLPDLPFTLISEAENLQNKSGQKVWQKLEFVFGWLYVLEVALKVDAYGFENYWRDGQNRFDFVNTWVIVIGETATFVSPKGLSFLSNGEWIRYLLIARMLRLKRLLMNVRSYHISNTHSKFNAAVGYHILRPVLLLHSRCADLWWDSECWKPRFGRNRCCRYPSGMVTLHNLLVMGNRQVWMQSYKELTKTAWTKQNQQIYTNKREK